MALGDGLGSVGLVGWELRDVERHSFGGSLYGLVVSRGVGSSNNRDVVEASPNFAKVCDAFAGVGAWFVSE